MLASAWATFASYVFLTIGYFVVSQRLWPVSIDRRKALLALLITGIFTIAVPLLPNLSLAAALPVKVAYVAVCCVLLVALEVVDRREIVIAGSVLRRFNPVHR
jgi:hypothetical protein